MSERVRSCWYRIAQRVACGETGREHGPPSHVHGVSKGELRKTIDSESASSGMSGAWRGRRLEMDGQTHDVGPQGVTEVRVRTSSGLSGARRRGRARSLGTGQGSVSFPDAPRCRALKGEDRAHHSACMSCASCGSVPRLATGQNIWYGRAGFLGAEPYESSSLSIAGMEVNDDADDVAFDELGGQLWILSSERQAT